jgi:hypothetical protein
MKHDRLFVRRPNLFRSPVLPRGAYRTVLATVLIVAVLLLAWPSVVVRAAGRPTPGASPPPGTSGAPAVATPTPQPVVNKECAALSKSAPAGWTVAMCDSFDDNSGGWDVAPHKDALGAETRTVSDGGYTWSLTAIKPFFVGRKANLEPMADFYAAVDTHKASGPEGNPQYGFQFRWVDANNYYMFLVSDSRTFKLYREIGGKSVALQDWTSTEALLANDWNRVAVKALGPEFTFYVNDQEVFRVTDATFPKGLVRLAVQQLDAAVPGVVDFDNFEVRAPSGALALAATAVAAPTSTVPPRSATNTPALPPPATDTPAPPPPPATDTPAPPPPPPTDTPVPTPPRPTATPAPTGIALPPTPEGWTGGLPTVVARDVTRWPMVFFDMFDDNGNNWPIGEDFSQMVEASKAIDQTLAWQFKGTQGVSARLTAPYDAVTDFYVAVDAKRYSGPTHAQYGLSFREVDSDNFYLFLANDDGKFEARALVKDRWYPLVGVTKTKAIRPGQPNRLAVKCEGPKIVLFINGQQVGALDDIRFRKGKIALALDLQQADVGIMEFDNFEIRTPPQQ